MARSKSIILTPGEKRSAVADLKKKIKDQNAALKDFGKILKQREKDNAAWLKGHNKLVAALEKDLAKMNGDFAVLTAS
jgi:hypothetical protein